MTDHELLKRAKKVYFEFYEDNLRDPDMRRYMERWNPFEDDGDALRLAVRLGLLLECHDQCAMPHDKDGSQPGDWLDGYIPGSKKEDPDADMRRAIVRAAAAMAEDAQ